MEANASVTESSPKGKPSPFVQFLRRILDAILVPFLAVFTALVIGAIIIVVTDANVWAAFRQGGIGAGLTAIWNAVSLAYSALFSGALGDAGAISESLVASTPFIFAGLAVAFGFQGGLFNIGLKVSYGSPPVYPWSLAIVSTCRLSFTFRWPLLVGSWAGLFTERSPVISKPKPAHTKSSIPL
jgi:hypothetical protein